MNNFEINIVNRGEIISSIGLKAGFFILVSFLMNYGCSKNIAVKDSTSWSKDSVLISGYNKGLFDLTVKTASIKGTTSITSDGAVFDNTMITPKIKIEGNIKCPLNENGIVKFLIKNTSALTEISFSYITVEDSIWTTFKTSVLKVEKTDDYKEYTLDLSAQYGWLGSLSGISLSSENIKDGKSLIKSVKIEKGGNSYPRNMQIGPEEIISTYQQRAKLGYGMGPDGILGQWRNSDGSLSFVGHFEGKDQVFEGTPPEPFKAVKFSTIIANVDRVEFGYASIGQVVKDPTSDQLIGITHLERHYNNQASYTATLGISISKNNGESWEFLDECISQELPIGEQTTVSRDIGNGTILIKDDYLFVYAVDLKKDLSSYGLSVSRVALSELFAKAKENKVAGFRKYKDGQWLEPGIGGNFDNIFPNDLYPNFHYIQYNKVLNKYIMVMCQAPYYQQNDGDMMMLINDNMLDWKNAKRHWIACGKRGEQYPTMISLEQDSQTTSGDTFYIYYCSWSAYGKDGVWDWQKLWTSANYVRRTVTVKAD